MGGGVELKSGGGAAAGGGAGAAARSTPQRTQKRLFGLFGSYGMRPISASAAASTNWASLTGSGKKTRRFSVRGVMIQRVLSAEAERSLR